MTEMGGHLITRRRQAGPAAVRGGRGGRPGARRGRDRRPPSPTTWSAVASRSSSCTSARSTTTTSSTRPRPGAASRASTPAGATSRRSSPATSCWPRPRRSPPSLGTEVAGLLAATIGRLCEGEVLELRHAYDVARTEERLPRGHRGQDGGAVRHRLPRRRHRRRPAPRPRSTGSPSSAGATAWPSRSSTTCSTSSPPTSSSASRPATTSSRASTPCRCSARSRSSARDLGALLGGPIDGDDLDTRSPPRARDRAASTAAIDLARRYIDDAVDGAGALRRHARRPSPWPARADHLLVGGSRAVLAAARHLTAAALRSGRARRVAYGPHGGGTRGRAGPGAAHRHRGLPVAGVGVDGDRAAASAATSSTAAGRGWRCVLVGRRARRHRGRRRPRAHRPRPAADARRSSSPSWRSGFALGAGDDWAFAGDHPQSLGSVWPLAGVLTAGVAWGGPRRRHRRRGGRARTPRSATSSRRRTTEPIERADRRRRIVDDRALRARRRRGRLRRR